jgi:hypothetical protein
MMIVMRPSPNRPEDVSEAARSLALQSSKDFPCFTVNPDAEPITLQHTLELEDE